MKKRTKKLLISIIIVALISLFIYFCYPKVVEYFQPEPNVIVEGELSIHFIELGNKNTGDCIYIKAGETDLLIDAGSKANSADDIVNYLDEYVEDETLEYIIATHAHEDHIAALVGNNSYPGIFDEFNCEMIIDFPKTNSTSQLYKNYLTKRDKLISEGTIHFNALECYKCENGAKSKYELAEGIELEILYNYYYDHKTSNENDYSVCFLINQGTKHFLFTGDLEKNGEQKLVEYNDLPEVELFKGGHHGSYTATTDSLLKVIKPKIIVFCCVAGSSEYTSEKNNMFPAQDVINRIAKYTDKVYVTTQANNTSQGYQSLNGNIVIISNSDETSVECSNNNLILKESDWFKENRLWP